MLLKAVTCLFSSLIRHTVLLIIPASLIFNVFSCCLSLVLLRLQVRPSGAPIYIYELLLRACAEVGGVSPQLVGIGLSTVFELVRSSADSHPEVCLRALQALLGVLEGLPPEALCADEPLLLGTCGGDDTVYVRRTGVEWSEFGTILW